MAFIKGLILPPFTSLANLPLVLLQQNQILIKYEFTSEDQIGICSQMLQPVSSQSTAEIPRDEWQMYLRKKKHFGTNLPLFILRMQHSFVVSGIDVRLVEVSRNLSNNFKGFGLSVKPNCS